MSDPTYTITPLNAEDIMSTIRILEQGVPNPEPEWLCFSFNDNHVAVPLSFAKKYIERYGDFDVEKVWDCYCAEGKR